MSPKDDHEFEVGRRVAKPPREVETSKIPRPSEPRTPISLATLRELGPRTRLRLALAGGGLLFSIATLATCGGCGKGGPAGADTTAAKHAGGDGSAPLREDTVETDAAALRDMRMWQNAKDGEVEDLATLATHEGAIGLVEATGDPALRRTAIKAMAYARGWAQLPFLARTSIGKDDDEAHLALESTIELAARPRRAEDPEDADELRRGCADLVALARDTARPRSRRVAVIRALRMMPCPPLDDAEALPTDVDAK